MNETETRILSIAGWKIHGSRHLIEKGEQSVRLQPRTMAVLTRLVESPGEVVTRQQLEDFAWPNMVVGYDALSHIITKLRKVFGDDPKSPRFIETIPKVGYRLIADVSYASMQSEENAAVEKSAEGSERSLPKSPERRLSTVGVTALLIIMAAGISWWQPWEQRKEPAPNTAARDAYLQGLSYYRRNTPADNAKAAAHFKRAIEIDPAFKGAYAALGNVYFKCTDPEFSNALLLLFSKAMFLAHRNLSQSAGSNSADEHILRSRIALFRHQVEAALREAERALEIRADDIDALSLKASALIYSGQYSKGRELVDQIKRPDSVEMAESLYITGLSYFASGDYDKAASFIEQALEAGVSQDSYHLLLAATFGKLGMKEKSKNALLKFRETWIEPFWMAVAVYLFPFEDEEVLKNLADGFEVAGVVVRPPSRYLILNHNTRLSGKEIEALLFGHTIKGTEFIIGSGWSQRRTKGGKLSHSGTPIHIGVNPDSHNPSKGESWIDNDRLCNRWFDVDGDITSCALIFRSLHGDQDHYYMVTDFGPNPFQVSN